MPMSLPNRVRNSTSIWIARLSLAASLSIVMYGCSTQAPIPEPPPPAVQPPPPPPPVVEGPREVGKPKVTTASFYSPALQGHPTTSGESYDEHAMTAASKTLPIGSHAKVTNLKTGKSVVVRINDHGPYVKGRGIDLSRDAAKNIGIDHRGIAKVKVTRVEGPSSAKSDPPASVEKVADTSNPASNVPAAVASPATGESSVVPISSDAAGTAATETAPTSK